MPRQRTPFLDLRSFITYLECQGELKRISRQVDPHLEIAAIARRAVAEDKPALLFERVKGSDVPLVINLLASHKRIEMALGNDPDSIGQTLYRWASAVLRPTMRALWRNRDAIVTLLRARFQVARAPLFYPEQQVDLTSLPILQCWPMDAGRFITLPVVVTRDPVTGSLNMGIYRMQVHSSDTTGMHWQLQKGGGFHYFRAEEAGKPLEVAVAIGTDPITLLAAVAPLPEDISELVIAGMLRGIPTPVWPLGPAGLPVPATAEIVFEGYVPPGERRLEGPFGDHFGHYSRQLPFPVFHIRRMYRRPGTFYLASVVGKPPQEDRFLGEAVQAIFNPIVRLLHPEIRDLWAYYEAGFHNLLVVSVDTRYPKEALKTALGLLGLGQLSLTKVTVLVDAEVNPRAWSQVVQAIEDHFDSATDLHLLHPTSLDTLDFTGPASHWGSRLIIDATSPTKGLWSGQVPTSAPKEGNQADWVAPFISQVSEYVSFGKGMLVFKPKGTARSLIRAMVNAATSPYPKLMVAVSDDVDLSSQTELLWGIFTRFDPARDILAKAKHQGITTMIAGPIGIDATWKPGYPAPVEGSPTVENMVSAQWEEFWK